MAKVEDLNPFSVFVQTFKTEYRRHTVGSASVTDSLGPTVETLQRKEKQVNSEALKKNFKDGMNILSGMFSEASIAKLGDLELNEMEVNLEVTAEGKLAFLGVGTSLTGKTSFRLLFKANN
jgi:hypothetical protein